MINKFEPFDDNVLIKRHDPAKITPGGIHIPTNAEEQRLTAEIVAVGPGFLQEDGNYLPLHVKPGDVVLLKDTAGWGKVDIGGETHVVIAASSCLGRVS